MLDLQSMEEKTLSNRYLQLKRHFQQMASVLVAFSGGVDSSVLLMAALDAIGESVLAVTAVSPLFPSRDLALAQKLMSGQGIRWQIIETHELQNAAFRKNSPDRCYLCKRELFEKFKALAMEEGLATVVEGSNLDDLSDYRPGIKALKELDICSPFIELGIGKQEIRCLARYLGLSNWDRPSNACLASRIPYGEEITLERLMRISRAEEMLIQLGFDQLRVRDHGVVARIEIADHDLARVLEEDVRGTVVAVCKEAGYKYVTLDLQGYRTGSMNENLKTQNP